MSASKPLLVLLFPAVFAVPLLLPAMAGAQPKAAGDETQPAPPASLTAPARPATTIAPRQSLPTFTSVKATIAPVLAAPTAGQPTVAQPITPPVPAKPAVKEAALPSPQQKTSRASLSARERSVLAAPTPVSATPLVVISRQRRAFSKGVSLATSPLRAPELPVTSQPVAVAAIAPLPPVSTPQTEAPLVARPSVLAAREAKARELALARLDAQLAGAEGRLNRAQSKLTEGQRQLGSVSNLLQSAMLSAGGSGLHPFVRVAQRYLGTPYVWGGESARGFDCSGFIMRVMRDLGYKALPHSAAEQFNYGKPISKGLLQPGDIVFFANTYKPGVSHVGIYLGGGRFIHAANSQVGTIVSNLNEPKWIAHYAGARRLMKVG